MEGIMLTNPQGNSNGLISELSAYQTAGGTANALTLTASSFSLANGKRIFFIAAANSTTSVTLAVNGGAAKALKNEDGSNASLTSGKAYEAWYSQSGDFFTLRPKGGASKVVGTGDIFVRFYDYDGTLLQVSRCASGGNITPPSNPTHDGLTFQEWNHPSANFTGVTMPFDVGATYITTDGKTHLKIEVNPVTGLAPTLYLNKSDTSELSIDWGDGSAVETNSTNGNITPAHTYASAGRYTVKLWISSGTGKYRLGQNASNTTVIGGATASYQKALTKAFIGQNVDTVYGYSFQGCGSLEEITIPQGITSLGSYYTFQLCDSLKAIIIPYGVTAGGNLGWFAGLRSAKAIVFPKGFTTFTQNCMQDLSALDSFVIPEAVTTLGAASTFANATNIKYFVFLPSAPPTLSNVNVFSLNPLEKIYVPDASVNAYKAATNWTTYADYIYPISDLTYDEMVNVLGAPV